ncbi:hypothetical protein J3R83DRAFT_12522 [Lanmaoa asiatica]|nr:hypothetical protein J3R83DRAFT_12522 [Lanmaoa asiatica]
MENFKFPPEKTTSLNVQNIFDCTVETNQWKYHPSQLKYKPSVRSAGLNGYIEDS